MCVLLFIIVFYEIVKKNSDWNSFHKRCLHCRSATIPEVELINQITKMVYRRIEDLNSFSWNGTLEVYSYIFFLYV